MHSNLIQGVPPYRRYWDRGSIQCYNNHWATVQMHSNLIQGVPQYRRYWGRDSTECYDNHLATVCLHANRSHGVLFQYRVLCFLMTPSKLLWHLASFHQVAGRRWTNTFNAKVAYRTSDGYAEAKLHLNIQSRIFWEGTPIKCTVWPKMQLTDSTPSNQRKCQYSYTCSCIMLRSVCTLWRRPATPQPVISCCHLSFLPVDIIPCCVVSATMSQSLDVLFITVTISGGRIHSFGPSGRRSLFWGTIPTLALQDQVKSRAFSVTLFFTPGTARWAGSSAGIATRYGLDGPGIESRWGRDFPHLSRPVLGPTQPPI